MTAPASGSGPLAGRRLGIVGGGTMGAGIAQVALVAGAAVVVVEADSVAASAARHRVAVGLEREARRGRLEGSPDECLARLRVGDAPAALAEVDLALEAVPESVPLKRDVLTGIEAVVAESTVIATNTSSLALADLLPALRRPGRFCGLHFFNPVPRSALVEVVRHPTTEPETLRAAHQLAAALGKETIEVADAPGFATSRLGVAIGLEALRMLEEGVASAEDIDRGMVLGYRYPMGPLRLSDLVGLDVRLAIAEYLASRLGPRFEPPALLRQLVASGRLGRKTGQGIYRWESE